ncbi:hypothetical protein GNF10_25715 [Nostoc sp. UCD121]|uniref:hypothetical protein n=1 Tax=unclassified Nostoc TaxID=2593658 RepID=UPI001629653C|nr:MULTISPECIES: hypothetical protein [unclassified Nostoc]MBC1224954.1 hypothetical protein [Nostoc sp. UCD120]MBC1279263.1 hypothetical protein [Nostoc sp. UCD121]MBC1298760.1 hypothetical protein [Nostoc sp. UCD122]
MSRPKRNLQSGFCYHITTQVYLGELLSTPAGSARHRISEMLIITWKMRLK